MVRASRRQQTNRARNGGMDSQAVPASLSYSTLASFLGISKLGLRHALRSRCALVPSGLTLTYVNINSAVDSLVDPDALHSYSSVQAVIGSREPLFSRRKLRRRSPGLRECCIFDFLFARCQSIYYVHASRDDHVSRRPHVWMPSQ